MIVVTGATGNVGRPLVQALAAAGEQVAAVSRKPAQTPAPPGVQHRQADLTEPESLRPVLDGADTVYLLVSGAGAHLNVHDILDVAKTSGVRRIVLQSSQAAGTRPTAAAHAPLRAIEEAIQQSGLDWTVLRPGGFATNAFGWADAVRSEQTVSAPFGDVGLPVIDPTDIAAVAAVVLREDSHAGHTYELTGPALTSPRERAQAIGAALGITVRFVEQSRAAARAQMLRFMPEPVVDGTLAILGEPLAAEARVSPHVRQILGRTPGTFAEWAVRNIAAFR
jgi:uncharacterized protein YbjT (DUF2867 family)